MEKAGQKGLEKEVRVALVRGDDRQANILRALRLIKRDIRIPDRPVLIKPNFVSTRIQLAATHVDAVRATLIFLSGLGVKKFIIGEGPAGAAAEEGFRNFGYHKLAREWDIEFVDLNQDEWTQVEIFDRKFDPLRARIARTALDSYRVSVTRPKTHDVAIVTLGLKNMAVGCLIGEDKGLVHQGYQAIHLNLARLARVIHPHLTVIDGFTGMEGAGPVYGTVIPLRTAIVGVDPVAVDSVAAYVMGFDPSQIGYLWYCRELGLGCGDLDRIKILGHDIAACRMPFTPHFTYPQQLNWKLDGWREIFAKLPR